MFTITSIITVFIAMQTISFLILHLFKNEKLTVENYLICLSQSQFINKSHVVWVVVLHLKKHLYCKLPKPNQLHSNENIYLVIMFKETLTVLSIGSYCSILRMHRETMIIDPITCWGRWDVSDGVFILIILNPFKNSWD